MYVLVNNAWAMELGSNSDLGKVTPPNVHVKTEQQTST